ncbi:chitinase, partial [Rhyzopertha dominica]
GNRKSILCSSLEKYMPKSIVSDITSLSVTVAAPVFIVDNSYCVKYMNEYVDYVNLMSYDFHFYTKYTPFTGINAPLYSSPDDQQWSQRSAPALGYGKLGHLGFADFNEICRFLTQNSIKPIFDMEPKSPHATKYNEWVSFDYVNSLTYKTIIQHQLLKSGFKYLLHFLNYTAKLFVLSSPAFANNFFRF